MKRRGPHGFAFYLVITACFWLLVWLTGGVSDSVNVGVLGVVINAVLLFPLYRGSYLALASLVFEAGVLGAGIIALEGLPPFGSAVGLIGVLALCQAGVLLRMLHVERRGVRPKIGTAA